MEEFKLEIIQKNSANNINQTDWFSQITDSVLSYFSAQFLNLKYVIDVLLTNLSLLPKLTNSSQIIHTPDSSSPEQATNPFYQGISTLSDESDDFYKPKYASDLSVENIISNLHQDFHYYFGQVKRVRNKKKLYESNGLQLINSISQWDTPIKYLATEQKKVVTLSIYTNIFQVGTAICVVLIFLTQFPLFLALVIQIGFEWIVALFLSIIFLFYPALNMLLMFSLPLQSTMFTKNSAWILWFGLIFQISTLVINLELLVGDFAVYFNLMNSWWSLMIIWSQAIFYSLEILWYIGFLIVASQDYGVVFSLTVK